MKTTLLLCLVFLTGCGLTPKQIQALDGAMCNNISGYGINSITVLVGGASKAGITVDGTTCSVKAEGAK